MRSSPLLQRMLCSIEAQLHASVKMLDAPAMHELQSMLSYHLGWSEDTKQTGKRLRPLLTLLSCSGAGGTWEKSLPAAAAVELIHNFSLIHDDIEDHSATRRGRPAVWKRWGLAQGLNAGDAMFSLAFHTLQVLEENGLPAERILACRRRIENACLELTKGQYLDIAFETREQVSLNEYELMVGGKTGALLAAAAASGACLGTDSCAVIEAYHRFGFHLGLAFQIEDDILGIWGDPALTGKPAGDDLLQRKKTRPILHSLAHSSRFKDAWKRPDTSVFTLIEAMEGVSARTEAEKASQAYTNFALQALSEAHPVGEAALELEQLSRQLLKRLT
ncbi:MAG: polyprenyl synthetase family protein [Anaerolineales bacterium]|nr:polyprenyl synthetase family protein [Anaerolineales bacterium]